MKVQLQFDLPTAQRVAALLEADGQTGAAADAWWQIGSHDPYDLRPRKKCAELYYADRQAAQPLGSVQRSRFLLRLMGISFPTPTLANAYLENLGRLLETRPRRDRPGALVLSAGSGRCGSTSLASAFAAVPEACATHENPPAIFWEPLEEQLQVHWRRFRLLRERFAVVFDAAHWWLPVLPQAFAEFPDARLIGLHRDTGACVQSFLRNKGSGPGSLNHWAVPGNGIWGTSPGDPLYPSYAVPGVLLEQPDAAKAAMIERYVSEYNRQLQLAAQRFPGRVLLVRTEELSDPAAFARMSAFCGVALGPSPRALNVGGTSDSDNIEMTF